MRVAKRHWHCSCGARVRIRRAPSKIGELRRVTTGRARGLRARAWARMETGIRVANGGGAAADVAQSAGAQRRGRRGGDERREAGLDSVGQLYEQDNNTRRRALRTAGTAAISRGSVRELD